jgi:hypothetical protein
MTKSWGACLGRIPGVAGIILNVTNHAAEIQLSIDIGSEPISGSVSMGNGGRQQFRGWIELVATIESAREARSSSGLGESLGSFTGASGGQV